MNKKILMIFVVSMAMAMLATPVFAVGPINAEKSNNPNLSFMGESSVSLQLPIGMINEWIQAVAGNQYSHVQMKRVTEFYIGNCYTPTSASEVLYNKWNFLQGAVFYDFLISVGIPPEGAFYVAFILMPEGVYYKEVYMAHYI